MSHRIWLRWADASFMTTATISDRNVANSLASKLAELLPGAVVGIDEINNVDVVRGDRTSSGKEPSR